VLHPNLWSHYSRYQIEHMWFEPACEAGMLLLPPDVGWQAALIAADLVIGDQGSVTLYATTLDKPILLAASGIDVVPRTPPGKLASVAARLTPELPLREQIEVAIDKHRPGEFAFLTDQMISNRGQAARTLQRLCYEQLSLPLPGSAPPPRAYPAPELSARTPASFVVFSSLTKGGDVTVSRFPAALRNRDAVGPGDMWHLCADHAEPDRRLPGQASVVVRSRSASPRSARDWTEGAFGMYPGALITAAAIPHGCVARTRDGRHYMVKGIEPSLAASVLYTMIRARADIAGAVGGVTVRTGSATTRVRITPDPASF
jgi:hypothetical protein